MSVLNASDNPRPAIGILCIHSQLCIHIHIPVHLHGMQLEDLTMMVFPIGQCDSADLSAF